MERTIFEPEHEEFRATARKYFETECVPHVEEWEAQGHASREAWLKAGELGLLGWEMPEEYGGADIRTFASTPSSRSTTPPARWASAWACRTTSSAATSAT